MSKNAGFPSPSPNSHVRHQKQEFLMKLRKQSYHRMSLWTIWDLCTWQSSKIALGGPFLPNFKKTAHLSVTKWLNTDWDWFSTANQYPNKHSDLPFQVIDMQQLGYKNDAQELFWIKESLGILIELYSNGCPKTLVSHPNIPITV